MRKVILADNQDITRAGMMYVCSLHSDMECRRATDKTTLIELLKDSPDSIVVIDYTLFDMNDIADLQIFHVRFPQVSWVMFSFDLSVDFVRCVLAYGHAFSVLLKDSSLEEINDCLRFAMRGQSYICQRMSEMLFASHEKENDEDVRLTQTETEILKDIALGMTTRQIAEKRFSSFHTVNTHRKNIFRKLGVNNIHEATKYALRAGLVDSAEYYI